MCELEGGFSGRDSRSARCGHRREFQGKRASVDGRMLMDVGEK